LHCSLPAGDIAIHSFPQSQHVHRRPFDAKNRLSELVNRVVAGEVIGFTRRGVLVARLAPPEDDTARQRHVRKSGAALATLPG